MEVTGRRLAAAAFLVVAVRLAVVDATQGKKHNSVYRPSLASLPIYIPRLKYTTRYSQSPLRTFVATRWALPS